jgi:glutamate 5-kinase
MYNKVTLKVGSNVLTSKDGTPNVARISHVVEQIAWLRRRGVDVLFVSSGAVASGRQVIPEPKRHDPVSCRQLWASIGQVRLIQLYSELFAQHGLICSQVLATREDFRDRRHFLNMRNCLETLLEHGIIPVINENDVVSVNELMFTDNDELSGLITDMMCSQALIILSNVDGIYTGPPDQPGSAVIPVIRDDFQSLSKYISPTRSQFGRGGMLTKCSIARKVAIAGTPVHLANGFRDNIIKDILQDRPGTVQTRFLPGRKASPFKKWLAHSDMAAKGSVRVNEGAVRSLLSNRASSVLLVGVTEVKGQFLKGDLVQLLDEQGNILGLGRSEYSAETARKKLGERGAKPLIHYDYLYLKTE